MKKVKMKTILASPDGTANIGEIITVDDKFADDLINSNSAELIEEIKEEIEEEIVEEEVVEEEVKEFEKEEPKKKRR